MDLISSTFYVDAVLSEMVFFGQNLHVLAQVIEYKI